jgi:hypothetical protein
MYGLKPVPFICKARLVRSFRPALLKTFIQGLSALESSLYRMPVVNFRFPQLPAKQHDLLSGLKWEVQQAFVEILYLDTDRINFLDRVLGLLHSRTLPHPFARHGSNINQHAPGEKDILAEQLQFCFGQTGARLGVDCPPQQRLQNRQQRLRLVKRECLHPSDLRLTLMLIHPEHLKARLERSSYEAEAPGR